MSRLPPHTQLTSAADWTHRLRALGLRATRARVETLMALQATAHPQSHHDLADDLAQTLGRDAADRITVYRNLVALTRAGLVRREHGGDRIWRYGLADRQDLHRRAHPHFSCKGCGETQCLPEAAVRLAGAAADLGSSPDGIEVTLSGQCGRCQEIPKGLD